MNDNLETQGKLSFPTAAFRIVVVVTFTVLAAQLWRLQISDGRDYRRRADENHIREVRLPAPRGVIYDRRLLEGESRILAWNAPLFAVSLVPAELPRGREDEIYQRLASLIGMPASEVRKKVDELKVDVDLFAPVPVKYNIDRAVALRLDEARLELPGVQVTVESTRRYAHGSLLSHILGYTALVSPTLLRPERYRELTSPEGGYTINDRIGVDGLEDVYEQTLRGHFGRKRLEVEASGQQRELGIAEPPRPGSNLVLTIDLDLQRFVDTALREGLHNSPSGVAIVMAPKTGEVLAIVSQPGFDNNIFTDDSRDDELAALLTDPNQPFFNRAVSGHYPPGSTFKLITGIAALQEGVAGRETIIESRGEIFFENDRYPGARASQRLPEWNMAGLGRLNFIQAVANSSNIYFFILGGGYEKDFPSGPLKLGLGNDRLARYARMFGYGAQTGIDLSDEATGTIPDEMWKQAKLSETWFKGDTYNMAIGQGFVQATPLQVANVTSAIANGGTVYRPHLVRALVDANGNVAQMVRPDPVRAVDVESRHIQLLQEAMEAGFSIGTLLSPYRVPGLRVAGKTGTGEFAGEVNAQGELPTHGWFTGFAPADDPRISVTVFVDRGAGGKDAAPIAARILRYYFGIPEDLPLPPLPSPGPAPLPSGVGPRLAPTPAPGATRPAASPQVSPPARPARGAEGVTPQQTPTAAPTASARATPPSALRATPGPTRSAPRATSPPLPTARTQNQPPTPVPRP